MTTDRNQIEIFNSRQLSVRIGLVVGVVLVLVFGWFAVRWQLGNMLADLTSSSDPNAKEIAALAVNFAPADPLATWLLASAGKNTFTPDMISETAKNFETVTRLSPNDYRWWVELGRAREQTEEFDLAEQAYRHSLEIAPNYTYPHWQLGNFYLRRNRGDEAFIELKKAAENNSVYRTQVFSTAWDYYEKDTARLEQIAGDTPSIRADLATFYASKERAEDALRIWNTLSEEERKTYIQTARVIARAFYEKKIFRQSQAFVRELDIESDAKAETVQNAGFEKPIGNAQETYFGWKVFPVEKMDVKLDPIQKHEGTRSLRVSFAGYAEPTLYAVSQYLTIEPSANYQLTFWVRTENLKSGGMPALEISNAVDTKSITRSEVFPTGTNDWQLVKIAFTAPANADAVNVYTARADCGIGCPIFGTLWYDDFKLERIK